MGDGYKIQLPSGSDWFWHSIPLETNGPSVFYFDTRFVSGSKQRIEEQERRLGSQRQRADEESSVLEKKEVFGFIFSSYFYSPFLG